MKLKKIKILKLIIVKQIGIKKEGSNPKKKKKLKRLICKFEGLDTNFYVEREKKRKTK
jgi:hypothetical protein